MVCSISMDPLVHIVLPVYNEDNVLAASVRTLSQYLERTDFPYRYRITIVDNASTDQTRVVAQKVVEEFNNVRLLSLSKKGKGAAIREGWRQEGDVLAFMDIDLASDLIFFKKLIDTIVFAGADIAIGNRHGNNSKIRGRRFLREVVSRFYNLIVRLTFASYLDDHQCGFKAISRKAYTEIETYLEDEHWFFDTELLVVAMRLGYKIIPIDISWNDNLDSKVSILRTSHEMAVALYCFYMRLRRYKLISWRMYLWPNQFLRFIGAGVSAAVLNVALFTLLTERGHFSYVSAVLVTSAVVFIMSFYLQKFWTFKQQNREQLKVELILFGLSALLTVALNTILLHVFIEYMHIWAPGAQLLALAILAPTNFILYQNFVFR